jgi:hypothetical protein
LEAGRKVGGSRGLGTLEVGGVRLEAGEVGEGMLEVGGLKLEAEGKRRRLRLRFRLRGEDLRLEAGREVRG